jgi:hypothetical protein
MSRAGPKFTDAQREAVYTLKQEGKSGRAIAEICAQGFGDLPPFSIHPQYANELAAKIARRRDALTITDLAKQPAPDALHTLSQRMISIGEREIDELAKDQAAGKMDARKFASVARSLKELQQLSSKLPAKTGDAAPKPAENEDQEAPAPTFLGALIEDHEERPPVAGDVKLPSSAAPINKARAAPPIPQPEAPGPAQPRTGVDAQIHAAAKLGRRQRAARAAHAGREASEAKHRGSEARALANGHSDTDAAAGQDARSGLNGGDTQQLPPSVARVLARRS